MRTLPLFAAAAVTAFSTAASAYTVTPMSMEVQAGQSVAVTVDNSDSEKPLTFEATVLKRLFTEDGAKENKPSEDDFVVVPPTGVIPAHSTQTVRLQYLGSVTDRSQHYYLNVSQVSVDEVQKKDLGAGATASLAIKYAYNAAVNVNPPGASADIRLLSAKGGVKTKDGKDAVEIVVENKGAAFAYLNEDYALEIDTGKEKPETLQGAALSRTTSTPLTPGLMKRRIEVVTDHPFPAGALKAVLKPIKKK